MHPMHGGRSARRAAGRSAKGSRARSAATFRRARRGRVPTPSMQDDMPDALCRAHSWPPGMSPSLSRRSSCPAVGSATVPLPAARPSQSLCDGKLAYRVRGTCAGVLRAWQNLTNEIDCGTCPRIPLNPPTYAACAASHPAQKPTTPTTAVMLPPAATASLRRELRDGNARTVPAITNATGNWNQPFPITITHLDDDQTTLLQSRTTALASTRPKARGCSSPSSASRRARSCTASA